MVANVGVVVSDRGDAVEMVVTGAWTAEAATVVQAGEVDRLVLNYALGFDEPSLKFLDGLPIRELVIIDRRLSDLEPIHSLGATLRVLSVTTNPALTIDLSELPLLRSVSAAWPQIDESIAASSELRVANLRGYAPADLRPLAPLRQLVELVMKDRPRVKTLAGLSGIPDLRRLGIYLAKDLADIEDLNGHFLIEELALEACRKITRLDAVAACTALRKLNLSECGDLESLGPLRALTNLENLSLYGSTRIADGDLTPIAVLPRLRHLRMQSRRSYRPTVEEVEASLRLQ